MASVSLANRLGLALVKRLGLALVKSPGHVLGRTSRCGVAWLMAAGLVSGCSWFDGEDGGKRRPTDDYLNAIEHESLVVPDDLGGLKDTDPFPIPPITERINPAFYPERPPLPDALYGDNNRDEVRLQKLGERNWLVVPEAPTTTWPKLKQFIVENGVLITYDAPQVGRINTAWMQVLGHENYQDVVRSVIKDAKGDAAVATGTDRFLIRVEQGLRPNSSEIHLRHENDSQGLPLPDNVDSLEDVVSHLPQAEIDMLNEVGAYIVAKVSETTVSQVALQIGSEQKSEIAYNSEGFPVLRLFLDYDRAWATLGQALGNASVDILDLSREDGTFYLSIAPEVLGEPTDDGFLCKLTFSCGDSDQLEVTLHVAPGERGYDITVRSEEGQYYETEMSQQVLVMIRDFAT